MSREKFGLAEFEALEAEMPRMKKSDVKTVKLILKVVDIPNTLLSEAREGVATARRVIADYHGRIKKLNQEITSASKARDDTELSVKRLEKVLAKFG